MARPLARIVLIGLGCALLVFAGGNLLRRVMLGADDEQARQRIRDEVQGAFTSMALQLREVANRAGAPADVRVGGTGDDRAAERLFASTADAVGAYGNLSVALTVYALDGHPIAWAGRPTEIEPARLQGRDTWFLVEEGDLGLRLVYMTAVMEGDGRVGTAASERQLSMLSGKGVPGSDGRDCESLEAYCFPTRLGPVTIVLPADADRHDAGIDRFTVESPSGDPLFTALSPPDPTLAHDRWRKATRSVGLSVIALTLLVMVAPVLDARNRARRASSFMGATLAAAALILAARALLSSASFADWTTARLFSGATYASFVLQQSAEPASSTEVLLDRLLVSPFDFLLTTLMAAALVTLAAVAVERWRLDMARRRLSIDSGPRYVGYLLMQLAAGCGLAVLLVTHRGLLRDTIEQTTLDLVHFSLQPWDSSRTALQLGLIVAHATVALLCVMVLRAALLTWRLNRGEWPMRVLTAACWFAPLVAWQAATLGFDALQLPLLVAAGAMIAAANAASYLKARYRHGSQAFRLTLLAMGVVVPAFTFYPTLFHEAGRAKTQLVETRYAGEVITQRQTLQTQLERSLDEIDALAEQIDLTSPRVEGGPAASTDSAFRVWQRTALAVYPITSAIELYDADGRLLSRFAFNLPEDLTATPRSEESQCNWLLYGEVAAFFAEERPVLHAGRVLCSGDARVSRRGSIVVLAMLDYENLPFISSRLPYRQIFRTREAPDGSVSGTRVDTSSFYSRNERDVEFAFYGWSFRPLYPSNQPAWQLDDAVTRRLEDDPNRAPFWWKLQKGEDEYDVYLLSDRSGIYALGVPVVTPLGHLVNLAELTVLAAGLYIALLAANALFTSLGRRTVRAPALLREIRASFYRKLFLAFVAAVILPVGALALVTRNYVVQEMRVSVEQEAVRTASAARRVVEDLVTQLAIGLDDNLMVWVSRLIDQDVNVFEGPRLVATSERNLFASGSLSTRAPADVFWALQLKNQAATVAHDRVGTAQDYLVAATPLTTTARDPNTMLTVPLTSGQQEIEVRTATLNRHLLLGALLFILAGAGLGYSMAERISDPVNRLTRATRRISRGDLDARIVARSSDELRRLVEDFNSMAAELQRQQKALERTHRLEAWAEMARQVAHDIKNPLTPIQLTAEHLRRVHADRGEPLSPVLQDCVGTILAQVRLLRQIASEFSSFASLPIAKPAPVSVPELLSEILEPYRLGLQDRIRFSVDIPPTLPLVHVDRTLVARALTNILENALHAMPVTGTLTLRAEAGTDVVRIRVADSGAGMDPEALARAFEPYFSTKASGTGLGLPIAKRNIELNGGTISITSERDRGTSVAIRLPLHTTALR
jgi:signal transduction histidine kinase